MTLELDLLILELVVPVELVLELTLDLSVLLAPELVTPAELTQELILLVLNLAIAALLYLDPVVPA